MQTIRKQTNLLAQTYEPWALLRDQEHSEILVTVLQSLDGFAFRIELGQVKPCFYAMLTFAQFLYMPPFFHVPVLI